MDFDCFKWDFAIFRIDNEYKDVYGDFQKLGSDFSGWLCEEKIANMWLLSCTQNWNRGHFRRKLVMRTWHNEKLWFLVDWYLNELDFNRRWDYLILSCVHKVWPIYWRPHRIHWNWEQFWIGNFTKQLELIGSLENCDF